MPSPPPDDRDPVFTAELGPEPAGVSALRRDLADWLGAGERGGCEPEDRRLVDDVLLIVSELATNAIRAARTRTHVRVVRGRADVAVEVHDDGPGLAPAARAVLESGGATRDRYRGLGLVSALSDEVWVATGAAGTAIRCRRRR